MMHEIKTEIEINAPAETVWSILLNFSTYSEWNPFIRSIEGVADKGNRLKVLIQPPGGSAMTFRPVLLVVIPRQELRWIGHLILPGIFDGEHYFQLILQPGGCVKFIQGEKFSGILVRLLKSGLEGKTRDGFMAMNSALKSLAESHVTP